MTPSLIHIHDLSKAYQRGEQRIPVLEGVNLDVADGEFVALMGPSGSGKSTLLNLIAGIDKPTSGRIEIAGIDIATLSEGELADWRAANVGFIFQFYNLMPVLTAFENVELPLLLTRLSRSERKRHVQAALAREPRRPHRPLPERALGRPAAAGRDRARHRFRPDADRRRRADGRPRPRDRRRGARPSGAA
jgi:ABC-type lipoprotein export system ATPase subunit